MIDQMIMTTARFSKSAVVLVSIVFKVYDSDTDFYNVWSIYSQ